MGLPSLSGAPDSRRAVGPVLATVAGGWQLVLVDPPWRFVTRSLRGMDRNPERHYACMDPEAIAALLVGGLAARDALLLLWATSPHLETAHGVGRARGFAYKAFLTWDKELMGTGYSWRSQAELLLLYTRGAPGLPADRGVPNLLRERLREHSRKPERLYRMVDGMWPHRTRRLELFARTRHPGWTAWVLEPDVFPTPLTPRPAPPAAMHQLPLLGPSVLEGEAG
jgi:N6-adenosine-specific RNA methylase IME4